MVKSPIFSSARSSASLRHLGRGVGTRAEHRPGREAQPSGPGPIGDTAGDVTRNGLVDGKIWTGNPWVLHVFTMKYRANICRFSRKKPIQCHQKSESSPTGKVGFHHGFDRFYNSGFFRKWVKHWGETTWDPWSHPTMVTGSWWCFV